MYTVWFVLPGDHLHQHEYVFTSLSRPLDADRVAQNLMDEGFVLDAWVVRD